VALVAAMLFMIGVGLGDENDVTTKGDAAIRASSLVVLEMYTSILAVNTERLVSQLVGLAKKHICC
jgi:diphthamide biosynthesis methyltransferase